MKNLNLILFVSILILVSGCATYSKGSDWDTSKDLHGLRAYAWSPEKRAKTGDYRIDNPLLETRVRKATDSSLEKMGYSKVLENQADFLIQFHVAVKGKLDVTKIDVPYQTVPHIDAYGNVDFRGWNSYDHSQTFVTQYEEGTLLLDFFDPQTKKLLWRGWVSGTVDDQATPEKNKENIRKGVEIILAQFPPE